jgi:high-affinity nickel-transport protein
VALVIGSIELLQVLISALGLRGGFCDVIAQIDFGRFGYVIAGLFLLAWGCSVAVWKFGRIEERYGEARVPHRHTHTHEHLH